MVEDEARAGRITGQKASKIRSNDQRGRMSGREKAVRILVVGGAGYIGSHMVKFLGLKGCQVTTYDNLSTGYQDAVVCGEFIHGDLADEQLLNQAMARGQFDAVMHFASLIQVAESVREPAIYYHGNVANSVRLFNAAVANGIRCLVFSSSAAVFANSSGGLISEGAPKEPANPYGRTKLMVEQMLADYDSAYSLKSACLRYFNAAGADPAGALGERHEPETHLIPLVLQVASGRREYVSVYGNDYDTDDGTCVRDFIHVWDLCEAHWLALGYLAKQRTSIQLNLGSGTGASVQEVINTAGRITDTDIRVRLLGRRPGDPARLVADPGLAKNLLGWQAKQSALETIIEHAWNWEQKRQTGRLS
jgi:UDP-glucose 4-epimerase